MWRHQLLHAGSLTHFQRTGGAVTLPVFVPSNVTLEEIIALNALDKSPSSLWNLK